MEYNIPAAAFSDDGCIINQACFCAVPYGRRFSDYNGCGWIAAYNLLHLLGSPAVWQDTVYGMRRATLLSGELGTDPFALRRYLKRQGVPTKLTLNPKKAAKTAASAKAGILMYWHGRGAHFAAFSNSGGDLLHFFNIRYGNPAHYETMSALIGSHSKFPLVFMLTV